MLPITTIPIYWAFRKCMNNTYLALSGTVDKFLQQQKHPSLRSDPPGTERKHLALGTVGTVLMSTVWTQGLQLIMHILLDEVRLRF